MQVILTNKTEIKTKAGKEFTIYHGIDSNGDSVTVFFDADKAKQYPVPAESIVPKDKLNQMFKSLPTVDVEYNSQGRVNGVYIPE